MRIISTKISLDSLTSKLPGIIPSIMNSWSLPPLFNCGNYDSNEKYYNYTSAVKRAAEFNVNAAELEHHATLLCAAECDLAKDHRL